MVNILVYFFLSFFLSYAFFFFLDQGMNIF